MNEDEDYTEYVLTPKGFLLVELAHFGLDEEDAFRIWDDLRTFVDKSSARNGWPVGYPALLFDNDGGECVTVVHEEDDDD